MVTDKQLGAFLDRLDAAIASLAGLQMAADRLRGEMTDSQDTQTKGQRLMKMSDREYADHKASKAVSE